jgi:tetratricopeptide (TPR) repeat protein
MQRGYQNSAMKKTKRDKIIKPARTENKERPVSVSLTTLSLSLLIICALAATAYQRNSIYHDFITLWGNITKTSPNKRRAHENYGQALSTVGRLEEALREFNTVIALKDDGSVPMRDLYREIGVVYFRMNRMADAISAWQTGLRHAPNDASLLNNLSIALLQTGQYEEAAKQAQTALSADPNLPQALNTMGQVLMLKKENEKAVQYFLKAIEQQPDVPARYWNVALALEQTGKYDSAMQYARKYMDMEQDSAGRQRASGFIEHLNKMMGR